MSLSIDVVDHEDLASADLNELRRLFDSEYLRARTHGRVIGHVGWARRDITVVIAGTGGVLVSREARGEHVGAEAMEQAVRSMTNCGDIASAISAVARKWSR